MPKFKVYLQQYVEQVATVEVEAVDEFDAIAQAKTDGAARAVWGPGDDAYSVEAYQVDDEAGAQVYTR